MPLGKAAVVRPGGAVTVLAYGTMVHVALAAAEESGIDAEVIDLRTLLPLDIDTIVDSVKKTGRCVVAHEATRTCGFGAELAALVQEHCFYHLEAPIVRVTGWDTPYPHAFEWAYFPGPQRVADGTASALSKAEPDGPLRLQAARYRRGHAEAEIVAWHVKPGDAIREEDPLVDVMTDKATVEIPAPVAGTVVALGGAVGEKRPVGSELVTLDVAGEGNVAAGDPHATGALAPPAQPSPAVRERVCGGRRA